MRPTCGPAEELSAPTPPLRSCLHHHPPSETAATWGSPGRRRPCQWQGQAPKSWNWPCTTGSCCEALARRGVPHAAARSCILCDSSAGARAIVLHSSCTGWLPRSYRGLGRGHKIICRSWKASMAPSSPCAGSTRARHDDPYARPHDHPRPPLSQRSFLWPKRLTAGVAAAKGGSGGAAGPAEVVGAIVTISNYATRPRYARPNTPHGGC